MGHCPPSFFLGRSPFLGFVPTSWFWARPPWNSWPLAFPPHSPFCPRVTTDKDSNSCVWVSHLSGTQFFHLWNGDKSSEVGGGLNEIIHVKWPAHRRCPACGMCSWHLCWLGYRKDHSTQREFINHTVYGQEMIIPFISPSLAVCLWPNSSLSLSLCFFHCKWAGWTAWALSDLYEFLEPLVTREGSLPCQTWVIEAQTEWQLDLFRVTPYGRGRAKTGTDCHPGPWPPCPVSPNASVSKQQYGDTGETLLWDSPYLPNFWLLL